MPTNDWDTSAEMYCIEAEKISFYQTTNRELITAAQIQPGMSIVDLSCGSGSTTRGIIASIGEQCTLYAVDFSEEMLRQAKRTIASQSVSFIHASADDFSRHIPQCVERVLCNAAFWHFPNPNAVLKEVHSVLNKVGCFLFNIPDQQFDFRDGKRSEMSDVVALCLHKSPSGSERDLPFSYQTVQQLASDNGLMIADFSVIGIPLQPEDLTRFYSIPHVGARHFPDRPLEERHRIFAEAFDALSPDKYPYYRWAQFVLKPKD